MDTHVTAIESGEDATVNLEENSMAYPEAPENSDVILFKTQVSQANTTFGAAVPASKLNSEQEQTEGLIDLSNRFKGLPQKGIQDTYAAHTAADKNQMAPAGDKNVPLLGKETPKQSGLVFGKPDTQINKNSAHIDLSPFKNDSEIAADCKEVALPERIKGQPKLKNSGQKVASNKKDLSDIQDNSYIVPTNTPLISHLTTAKTPNAIEKHAATISQQIKDQVIDRILVSMNDIAANKTVKVIINPSVLEGTEVNFQKLGEVLSIQFISKNENSLQFLQINQTDLQGYLQGELRQFKGVSVSIKANENNPETPEDGRSRNRYDYQPIEEDEQ